MDIEKLLDNSEEIRANERKEENTKGYIYSMLQKVLRSNGATKVQILSTDKKDTGYVVTADYHLNGFKRGEFNFVPNHMGNYVIKNVENSIEAASTVEDGFVIANRKQIEASVQEDFSKITFDMSLIEAEEISAGVYDISYPTVGIIGKQMRKENITEKAIEQLCVMAAENFKMIPSFAGEYKLNVKGSELPTDSQDKTYNAGVNYKYFVKSNIDKENDMFTTVRENTLRSIELKAQDFIKRGGTSYKSGIPQIMSTDSTVKFNEEGKIDGTVMVKAKINNEVITYALPICKGTLVTQGGIDTYKKEVSAFVDETMKKVQEEIKANVKETIEKECVRAMQEYNMVADGITKVMSANMTDIQKSFLFEKKWFEEKGITITDGMTIDIKGAKYTVKLEPNGIMCNLVQVK